MALDEFAFSSSWNFCDLFGACESKKKKKNDKKYSDVILFQDNFAEIYGKSKSFQYQTNFVAVQLLAARDKHSFLLLRSETNVDWWRI